MVFDADFHMRIFRLALHGLEDLDHLLDVALDAAVTFPISPAAEVAAGNRTSEPLCGADQEACVVLGFAPFFLVVRFRRGADAARADLEFDPRPLGLRPNLVQVVFLEALVDVQVGQEKRIHL